MRHLILLFIALPFATAAAANELVVGEPGSVEITLPNQPNNQKCNIEVKFADGSSQDVEVDPKNPSASVSFTPTIAGTQVIQWDGKMKWRGLKSRPPCEGDGTVEVSVRDSDEVLAERIAAQLKEDELFFEGLAAFGSGNYQSAQEIWTPLAEAGNVAAQFHLGFIFEQGGNGIASNTQMAISWYERAAAQGDSTAKDQLNELREKVAQEAKIRAEEQAKIKAQEEKKQKKLAQTQYWDEFTKSQLYQNISKLHSFGSYSNDVRLIGFAYINGEFELPDPSINSWEKFAEFYFDELDDFFCWFSMCTHQIRVGKVSWRGLAPPDSLACTTKRNEPTRCNIFYAIPLSDGTFKSVTPAVYLNEWIKYKYKVIEFNQIETAEGKKARCEKYGANDSSCPNHKAALAQQKADECRRNPLSYNSCPGYAAAKEEQNKRQLAAARERKRQEELRNKPLTKNTLKKGYQYTWYSDGSCTEIDKKICVTYSNYEWLCKNNDGVSSWALQLFVQATTPAEEHIASNGSIDVLNARWDGRYVNGCRVNWQGSGLYRGSSIRTNLSGYASSFIVNDQGEIIVSSASSWGRDVNKLK